MQANSGHSGSACKPARRACRWAWHDDQVSRAVPARVPPTQSLARHMPWGSATLGTHPKRVVLGITCLPWLCVYYALLKTGLAGSQANPFVSGLVGGGSGGGIGVDESGDLGFSKWLENIQGKPDKEAADKRKLVSKWHPTTKGTLRRNYRVPSKSEGRCLLKAIASLLSDDDHFTDATSHKGCQIRRESAHGESVCCNNVRALFDELPTPHLIVEITPFPAGPLTERDYIKAEKLERVLRKRKEE
ncbi:hypothetical protein LWI28_021662 [Acer negundo]|uniref:Uncharacterized protein n=1 Tax=Acer negundo TaxID=4023 RepID=A0AAD5JM89_ACENE|nr:hypothetical protein LWI28_021662 [Acer negundo]